MNIVLIADGIHILVDVVIIDPICANVVLRAAFSSGVAMMIVVDAKVVHIMTDTLKVISSF
jgi:hypothetical protein